LSTTFLSSFMNTAGLWLVAHAAFSVNDCASESFATP
jgi:hypothetical protein